MIDYFDERTVNRQRLLWTVATRRQLERWELVVATILRESMAGRREGKNVWSAEIERHFALVAGRNLLHALDLAPATGISIDPTLRNELKEGRDLNEHWTENMPIFNVTPRPAEPQHSSGKAFAERNPKKRPYSQSNWNSRTGAMLLPNVPAPALHELLDAVEAEVLGAQPELERFLPPRAPSPWIQTDGEWWPRA